ncbi:hypothetical protein GTP41_26100 [Pseudoduganella sp. DS3]|uniref:Uncharacterized protein n=1 Tax=Pseudoduganella guangdongensis TaxID=2692179 RepID=A0A6N9HQ34_9BURK|nr:hypothetical protein [Pseudoduganella guangdongensis]MYN05569.1 hypothetical protein [Pseudoduganella guangdongensis]
MRAILLAFILATWTFQADAQVVVQAIHTALQPQIGRDANGFKVCGIRAVVLDKKPMVVDAYDFSINIRADIFAGLIKAGKSTTLLTDFNRGKTSSKVVLPAPTSVWIAGELDGKPLLPTEIIPAETPGFILAGAELVQTWKVILAMMQGERMQFAVRYKDQDVDTVVSFSGSLKDEELKPLFACLEGLQSRMQN